MGEVCNQEMVRLTNQRLIINLIKEKGSISRADIAKTLNLSPPSTSSNIVQLLYMGIVKETGEGVSSGGRKPILLELNRQYGYIIGVDMSSEEVRVHLGSIYAEVMDTVSFQSRGEDTGIGLLIDLVNSINTLINNNSIERERIKVILIAAHGIIDKSANRMIFSSFAGWNDLDLVGALKMEYKTKIILKNCACAAAFGEYQFGIKQKCKNLLFISADDGISAGLVINGELYEGANSAAGSIGSTAFSREQVGGIYKKNGYLATTVSMTKLVQRIKNACKNDSTLLELCGNNINKLDFGILKRAYEKNHLAVKGELDRVVDLIAITVANINCLLNVDTIVLGGKMATLGEYYILSIKRVIGELCPFTPYIMYSTLKDNSTAYGILALGQQYILGSSIVSFPL